MAQPSTLAAPELLPLRAVIAAAPAGHEAAPGFEAWLAGARWTVTALLERTAVIADPDDRWADRRVERIDALQVTPGAVLWQRKPDPELRRRRRPRPPADPAGTPREAANELAPAP